MTNKKLIRKLLRALEYQCLDCCYDFDNESSIFEYDNDEYRLFNNDVEYANELIMRLNALEIVNDKGIDIGWLRQFDNVKYYNNHAEAKQLEFNEYEILKGVFND